MIKENIAGIKKRISLICAGANRDPESVAIVAVSKGRDIASIEEVVAGGITHIGENKVQEALSKYRSLSPITWHMVGHLQTNKAKDAVRIFDLIESVDSLRLAEEIDRQAAKIHKIQDILVEVNISRDKSKFGIRPEEAVEIVKEISGFGNIRIKGLMAIAPIVDDPETARPYFKRARALFNEINDIHQLTILSMGMSGDFEVAIQEGASLVRLGRVIFETGV
ncbi:MAG: YggS family pyridoxal phosphate-dependent enzyme [Candidatus Omnitrophota bacterium]|jgi:hypothetical protein